MDMQIDEYNTSETTAQFVWGADRYYSPLHNQIDRYIGLDG
jgi:hypothetical protein